MLVAKAKVLPESQGLVEGNDEWWIGMIAIPKSSRPTTLTDRPTYRRGWTFTLEAEMRFVSVPFVREDEAPALAIALRGATDDFFAGWFDAARSDEVHRIVDHLNSELNAERTRHPSPAAEETREEIVLEIGSAHAPDSPYGRERVRLGPSGTVRYERVSRGVEHSADGRVDPSMWTTIVESLSKTSFPSPPQAKLPPGGGVVRLSVSGSRSGEVLFDYYYALDLEGYRDVVGKLVELCDGIRTGDQDKLGQLGYDGPAEAPSELASGKQP